MSRVRTRVIRSSSHGELGVFNQIRPFEFMSPVGLLEIKKHPALVNNNVKPREEKKPHTRRVTWTWGSPERNDSVSKSRKKKLDEGFCAFLEGCALCKKKLKENVDVYMYGYLSAFCSPECRDDQIALDGFDKEVSKESTKITMGGMIRTKDRSRRGNGYCRTEFFIASMSMHVFCAIPIASCEKTNA
ncbi:uncharacterized protein LOC116136531 [Pistacia vera]|uniref:uncharacterized protein LOC116136531 n=1 Tax=Pistacia vera TaxID=55513 RepID=UPI001262BE4E|nr:uncharacterized protein LOC116136531 [Pistacia vera]